MRRMWLVGMPGAGKTTVGRAVATQLGVEFTDTDELVESMVGRSIATIWSEDGESIFREFETIVVSGLGDVTGVISSGGGAILEPRNRAVMSGMVVWLEARPETIASRLDGNSNRPLLAGVMVDRIVETLTAREALYASIADHRVSTDTVTIDEVVSEVVSLWPG